MQLGGLSMQDSRRDEPLKTVVFGRRKIRPSVCIVDDKQHIRTFLCETLDELGFLTLACGGAGELMPLLRTHNVDLVVLGLSAGGVAASAVLQTLRDDSFTGSVLIIGPSGSPAVEAIRQLASELCLDVLPVLATPFSTDSLRKSVSAILPENPPSAPVDVAEALKCGWLELWYQHKVDVRSLRSRGAEALIRMRHPLWGIVPPAYFIHDDGDPHFKGLSEFVISKALDDWRYFLGQAGPVNLSVNLPVSFLENRAAVDRLCLGLPNHPAFSGLMIEINGTEILRNLDLLTAVAKQIRFYNVAVSIADLGAEWPSLMGLDDFPFSEVKVDPKFIQGCTKDRLKRVVCRHIAELAASYGARAVAEGVETQADLEAVREMGFDLAQGFLFGRPATPRKFAQSALSRGNNRRA